MEGQGRAACFLLDVLISSPVDKTHKTTKISRVPGFPDTEEERMRHEKAHQTKNGMGMDGHVFGREEQNHGRRDGGRSWR